MFPPAGLRALDLRTGLDSPIVENDIVLGYGWDSTGRVVALTGTPGPGGAASGTAGGLAVWHGTPGSVTTAAVEASVPVDAQTFVASDGDTAYFGGSNGWSLDQNLWRYDFASHRLELALSIRQPHPALSSGSFGRPLMPFRPSYTGAPPYPWNLPAGGLPFIDGSGLSLLRYSDLKPARSIVGTIAGGAIYDATFTRYLARTGAEYTGRPMFGLEPSSIAEVDTATGRSTVVSWTPDPFVRPIGYLGSTRAFLFTSGDPKGVAVVLQEPGMDPRVILRVAGPYASSSTWPGLLGVQTAK